MRLRHAAAVIGLSILALALAPLAPAQAQQSLPLPAEGGFTPSQRQAIVAIVRDALIHDPSILRDAVTAMQTDDAQRQANAQSSAIAASRTALLSDRSDPIMGNPHGDVSLVEFYDVRCGYCRAMRPALMTLLKEDPHLRIVFKDIPILGPGSVVGARALLAAQAQGGYAPLQAALMSEQTPATEASVREDATRLGLNADKLVRDMASPAVTQKLAANASLAQALNVTGTPAFVIGDQLIPGAVSLEDLRKVIDQARAG